MRINEHEYEYMGDSVLAQRSELKGEMAGGKGEREEKEEILENESQKERIAFLRIVRPVNDGTIIRPRGCRGRQNQEI